jgi:hypothetical protein
MAAMHLAQVTTDCERSLAAVRHAWRASNLVHKNQVETDSGVVQALMQARYYDPGNVEGEKRERKRVASLFMKKKHRRTTVAADCGPRRSVSRRRSVKGALTEEREVAPYLWVHPDDGSPTYALRHEYC